MERIKRIPYGKADFEAVNLQNDYYVDKTQFIPQIEATPYIFLIRPRRFGKSLFLSTLETYYDINKKDKFKEFFRDTYILKNPTEEQGKYMILYFNFSVVIKDKDKVQDDFNKYCSIVIDGFLDKYKSYLSDKLIDFVNSQPTAHEKLYVLSDQLKDSPVKIYLMIDEYDNFTNSILADYGGSEYNKISREAGYFKQFFSNLKAMASGSGAGLARMFITGVSPVTMDDVTSGFNVGTNISIDEEFNEILGFTQNDVEEIINYYTNAGVFHLDKQETISTMKKWYDNYQFSKNTNNKIFNTDAILYFMQKTLNKKNMLENLIDDNLRMDYGKLQHLIVLDRQLNGNFKILKEIIENRSISANVRTSFPFNKLTEKENFISLLYFFGLLTYGENKSSMFSNLVIPNETISSMMYEYFRKSYESVGAFSIDIYDFQQRFVQLAVDGNFKPAFQFLADEIKRQTKIRDYISGEKLIQGFFLAYFNIFDFYISLSEEEMNKGYADIVMKPFYFKYPDIKYSYLIEFKYIARTDSDKELKAEISKKLKDAETKLAQYADDDFAKKMMCTAPYGDVKLKKIIVIFHGWEMVYLMENL